MSGELSQLEESFMLLEKNLHFSLPSILGSKALITFHSDFLATHPEYGNPSSCEGAGSQEVEDIVAWGG